MTLSHIRAILPACLCLAAIVPPCRGEAPAAGLPPGSLIARVVCADDAAQSYALYLPAAYTAERAWPIVYCFDPGARGSQAVERFQEAAERTGTIVAGSNNSHNGPWKIIEDAANAMIRDTHRRLHLDDNLLYATGCSGGARAACAIAAARRFAGVVASSGSFPGGKIPPEVPFVFFGAMGLHDFNYQEMRTVDAGLASRRIAHRTVVFDGGHEWMPASLTTDALEWLKLQAMRSGLRTRDDAFVAGLFHRRMEAVAALKNEGEAYEGYLSVASDFAGVADTADPAARAAALKETKGARQYFKAEKKSLEQEQLWLERLREAVEESKHPSPQPARDRILGELRQASGEEDSVFRKDTNADSHASEIGGRSQPILRPDLDRPASVADDSDRYDALRAVVRKVTREARTNLGARRALEGSFAAFSGEGQSLLDDQDGERAAGCLELAAIIRPEVPVTYFDLARAAELRGDRARAREYLDAAIAKGYDNTVRIEHLRASLSR
jgi:dienelactone hydrolase